MFHRGTVLLCLLWVLVSFSTFSLPSNASADSEAIADMMLVDCVAVAKQTVLFLCGIALSAAIVGNSSKIAPMSEQFFAAKDTFSCADASCYFPAAQAEICQLLS